MKFTRERVILGGLLLAAGAGLLADQYVFADRVDAPANEYAVSTTSATSSTPAPKAARLVPLGGEQLLAARLQQLAGGPPKSPEAVRDLFVAESTISATNPRPVAWNRRVLNGVLFGAEGKGVAIIDGRMVPVGSRLDGMQLIRVTKVMAVFSDGTNEITLKISQKPSPSN